jgi:hypothetical protein
MCLNHTSRLATSAIHATKPLRSKEASAPKTKGPGPPLPNKESQVQSHQVQEAAGRLPGWSQRWGLLQGYGVEGRGI